MGRFAAAKATNADNATLQRSLNYLIDLLDQGYSVSKTINGKLVSVTIDPNKVFEYTVDGVKHIYYNEATDAFVTSKYDVDEDGIVDLEDVQLILDCIDGLIPATSRMDVNGDGNVTILDATAVSRATGTRGYYPPGIHNGNWYGGFDDTGFYVSEDKGATKTYLHTW